MTEAISEQVDFPMLKTVKRWTCWTPKDPICICGKPARWLRDPFLDRRGVYLWTLPRPSTQGLRVFHIGCSYGKSSSLRERSLSHYNNYFAYSLDRNTREPVRLDKLPSYSKETGNRDSSRDEPGATTEEILNFLGKVRMIYLAPDTDMHVEAPDFPNLQRDIRLLEGAIARGVEDACPGHLTNTRGRTSACHNAMEIANPVNTIPGIGTLFP